MYYFGARYYDPVVSRWISADPIFSEYLPYKNDINQQKENFNPFRDLPGGGGIFRPVNNNLFHYGSNNPIIYIDIDGTEDIGVPFDGAVEAIVSAEWDGRNDVGQLVEDIDAKLVAVWSQSGSSARLLSKARIDVPILALSSDEKSCRQMCLHYGVIPCCQPIPEDIKQFTCLVDRLVLENNWAQTGDRIILVAGQPISTAGTTNFIHVHNIKV